MGRDAGIIISAYIATGLHWLGLWNIKDKEDIVYDNKSRAMMILYYNQRRVASERNKGRHR